MDTGHAVKLARLNQYSAIATERRVTDSPSRIQKRTAVIAKWRKRRCADMPQTGAVGLHSMGTRRFPKLNIWTALHGNPDAGDSFGATYYAMYLIEY